MRIAVSAGEVSGEQHLSRVVRALRELQPNLEVKGMAGAATQEAGAELIIDCYRKGATMGFSELVRSAGSIFTSFSAMKRLIVEWRPDILVLVDYPDFNLRLARVAHEHGVRVLYYVPPKVWAWRANRVKKIAAYVDRVAAIFPFEKDFYAARGYTAVTYVGHPLGDRLANVRLDQPRNDTLLLLPGSRKFEVECILPSALRVWVGLRRDHPTLKTRVVLAPNMSLEWVKGIAGSVVEKTLLDEIEWTTEEALTEMMRARVGILKSGTCNLEGAIAGLPFVSVYSGSWFSNLLVSLFVSLKEFSPVNIMRSGTVREVMQVNIDVRALEAEVRSLLDDGEYRARVESGLSEVRASLASCDTSSGESDSHGSVARRVAALALELGAKGGNECLALNQAPDARVAPSKGL
jgi:lipid-A-disaccharide synthase